MTAEIPIARQDFSIRLAQKPGRAYLPTGRRDDARLAISVLERKKWNFCQVVSQGGTPHRLELCRLRNTRGAQLSRKRSPTRLPTHYPHDWHLDNGAPIG